MSTSFLPLPSTSDGMDGSECVETSDPEELEIAYAPFNRPPVLVGPQLQTRTNIQAPRKRRKLSHCETNKINESEVEVVSSLSNLRTSDDGLMIRSSLGPSTPTAVSDDERRQPTEVSPSKRQDVQLDDEVDRDIDFVSLQPFSPGELPEAAGYNGSQDELDVISQLITQNDSTPPRQKSPASSLVISSDKQSAPNVTDNSKLAALGHPRGSLGLFSSQHEASSELGVGCAGDLNARLPARSPPDPPRFTSLPPSSPPRTSTSPITNTPQHSLSQSPNREGAAQPRSGNIGLGQMPLIEPENVLHSISDDQDGMTSRRYSLRARQARQLNPYEYDKLLYKRQMKRLPDAIVKVVSPRKDGTRRTHKQRESDEDGDFIVSEDEESQETTLRSRKPSVPLHNEDEAQDGSLSWLPEAFRMNDDDDLTPLSPLAGRTSSSKTTLVDTRERRKASRMKPIRFPLKEARMRDAEQTTMQDSGNHVNEVHPIITYKRRKDVRSSSKARGASISGGNLPRNSPAPPTRHDASDRTSPERSIEVKEDQECDYSEHRYGAQGTATPFNLAENDVEQSSYYDPLDDNQYIYDSSHSVSIKGASEPARSDPESDMDNSDEMSRINQKQWKALRRMMPQSWITRNSRKCLNATKRQTQSGQVAATDTEGSSSDSGESSLVPGKSRLTKRSNVDRGTREIKGDSDNSDTDAHAEHVTKYLDNEDRTNVINVESSSESEASATSSLHSDMGDILETSIANEGYFDHDYARQSARWKEQPLIDRMLCRTRASKRASAVRSRKNKAHHTGSSNGARLKSNGFGVSVSRSPSRSVLRRHRNREIQTRLRFEPADSASRYRDENTVDLTKLDLASMDSGSDDDLANTKQRELSLRLSKKQRREAVRKTTLHTFSGNGKRIASGRKKGFITVQIDMADDGLRKAIKPLHQEHLIRATPSRTLSTRFESPKQQVTHHHGRFNGKPALKQASLHDFAYDDALNATDHVPPSRVRTGLSGPPDWHDEDRVRTCTVDMGIAAPTPGLAFGAGTYLGKQLLTALLDFASRNGSLLRPNPYAGFGLVNLDPEMSTGCFIEAAEATCNTLSEWLDDEAIESSDEDNMHRYEHLMHSISNFASWVYENANDEGKRSVLIAASSCADRLTQKLQEKTEKLHARSPQLDTRCLAVMWFCVELTTRLVVTVRRKDSEPDTIHWTGAVVLLIRTLMKYGIERSLLPIEKREMQAATFPLRAAELWICIIHLLGQGDCLNPSHIDSAGTFWSIVLEVVKNDLMPSMTNIEISEYVWSLVFGLCAMSHFSPHGIATSEPRLLPCWDMIGLALDTIRLTHDTVEDAKVSRESLKRRDRYVRIVVARCFILGTKWKWPLRDANMMFKKLVDIFRSRNFGNLIGEEPEFPAFLRYQDIGLLNELRSSDSSFGVYLKLVIQATKADLDIPRADTRVKARLMKLLSLVVPLSGVAFSKSRPPTNDELSMLINRFSAIIIAILVEGRGNAKIQSRVNQARRFIGFVDADDRSRDLCIKAAMYILLAANHLSLDPGEPVMWLAEMCDTLLDEFHRVNSELGKEADAHKSDGAQRGRHRLVLSLHLLLRCITNIIERPTLTVDDSSWYPSVGLISGPWVKRVFPMKEFTNIVSTRLQILKLVQSFLKSRAKVIPPPRRSVPAAVSEDNSESQDLYVDLDLDDDILALVPLEGEMDDNWKKDKEAAEIMNSDIIPHIFRLLLQYFNDPTARPSDESKLEEYWSNADDWIDCWVGCAAVVVRNGIRTWDHYLNVGSQSWAGIGDSFFRRRVAVRFMYQLLKCDPTAYKKDYEGHFLTVLLHCLVVYRITMENDYLSALFSVDDLRHPLLRGLPVNRTSEQEEFHISRTVFLDMRTAIITGIFANLNMILLSDTSERDKNVLVECVLEMLSTLRDIWQSLKCADDRDKYSGLCRHVFNEIRRHPRIHNLQRISTFVTWGTSFDESKVS